MQSNYYVTEVSSKEDLAQAISLWERNLSMPVGTGMDKYHWFYETNPYRKGKLWLLKLKGSEKAVGVGGVGYRSFSVRGKSLMGVIGVDFAVDKGHRALGPALKLQRTIMESTKMDADFRYGFPSKQAEVALKYFGYHKIGEFTRLVKVLKSGDYLKRIVKPRFLARTVSIPADLFLRLRSIKSILASGNGFHSHSLENSYSFYDRLWEQVASEGLLMGERTSKFLDWRFLKCPNIKYKIFGVEDNNRDLHGYIVYHLSEKQVQVVDFICPGHEKESAIRPLIMNFEKHCFSIGASSVSISLLGVESFAKQLISIGYWKRVQHESVWIYTGKDNNLLAEFKNLGNSYWSKGDWH